MLGTLLPCLLLLTGALANPPAPTLDLLDQALERLADPQQVHRYRVTTDATYSDTDGDDAHTDVVVTELSWDAAGEVVVSKISHTHDGEPFGEEDAEQRREDNDQDGEKKSSVEAALPAGDDLARYRYGTTSGEDGLAIAPFEPVPGQDETDDLQSGRVAWDPATGQPRWIEFSPVDKPFMVKHVTTRLVLGQTDGRLHTARIVSWGVGGPPLLRKKFELDMRFHDIDWK